MVTANLEERVAALEAEIEQLKQRLEPEKASSTPRGWQRIVGIYKDDPEFEDAVRLGREWRESSRPEDYEKGA